MMDIRYVIKMKIPTRQDLDYYYTGKSDPDSSGPVFDYRRPKAKRYLYIEEAYRDLSIINAIKGNETLTVTPIKCRT